MTLKYLALRILWILWGIDLQSKSKLCLVVTKIIMIWTKYGEAHRPDTSLPANLALQIGQILALK